MSLPNPHRAALVELRFYIGHAARSTAAGEVGELAELDRKVLTGIGRFAGVAVEHGNAALFHTAFVMLDRYCTARAIDAEATLSELAKKWGAPERPSGVCTMCGRFWRAGDHGWRTWHADEGWDGEIFATCSADCSAALLEDSMPGYASFATDADLARFTGRGERLPPPRSSVKRRRAQAS